MANKANPPKPWDSRYAPGHDVNSLELALGLGPLGPILSFAEDPPAPGRGGPAFFPVRHGMRLVMDVGIVDVEKVRAAALAMARDHRLRVLNTDWRPDGVVLNFAAKKDAAKFRLLWDENETGAACEPLRE